MKTASLASAHGTAHADEKNRSDSEHTRDGNSSIDLSAFGIQIESEETRRRQEALQERRRAAMQKQQLRTELRDTVQHGRTLDLSARNLHSLGNAMGIPDSTRPHTHADRGGELGPSFEILSTPKISTQWSDLKPSKSSVSHTTTDHRENRSTLFSNAMQPNEAGAAPSHLTPQCFLTPPKLTPHGSVPMQDNTMSGWGMWVVDRSVQTDVSGVGVQNDEDATRSPTPKKLLSLCPLCRANHSVQCSSHDRVWNHDDRALCTQGLESKNERMGGTLQPHQEQVYLSIIYSLRQQLENLHVKLACVIRESAV